MIRQIALALLLVCAVGTAVVLFLYLPAPSSARSYPVDVSGQTWLEPAPDQTEPVQALRPEGSESTELIPVSSEAQGRSNDPETLQFLTHDLDDLSPLGEIVDNKTGGQDLVVDGKKVFSALKITHGSKAEDGTMALAATTRPDGTLPTDGDEWTLSEAWVVKPDGSSVRISPDNLHASSVLISPTGRFVAFTGAYVRYSPDGKHAYPGAECLIIRDLNNGTTQHFGMSQWADHSIRPVEWTHGDETLRVIQVHGETGGNATMGFVQMHSAPEAWIAISTWIREKLVSFSGS